MNIFQILEISLQRKFKQKHLLKVFWKVEIQIQWHYFRQRFLKFTMQFILLTIKSLL